ncbi:MAG: ribosome biogenesis GTPase Der, partial [Candidatus Omnitrophica bacterium]|nr:ribosome biogenesis GTPase Der [Candidatus Omnitrophota bacterium]
MTNYKDIFTICIVGRPNVGKSSLFNCLMGERRAVVVEQSGTTRDRLEIFVEIEDHPVKLVDTGGYVGQDKDELSLQVKYHIQRAIEEASILIMVTDVISGISPYDEEVAAMLKKSAKPVIVVANKADNEELKGNAVEFYRLGFGEPESISCLHRQGLNGLKDRIRQLFPEDKTGSEDAQGRKEKDSARCVKIAVVGRPNVGKSSFVNALLKRNRVIVSDIPGTTRDSIDTHFSSGGDEYILIDTAGIKHTNKVKEAVDMFSMMRSKESIQRADVAILLLSAAEGLTRDDIRILEFVEENGKACLIAVNKWDQAEAVEGVTAEDYKKHLIDACDKLRRYPISFISSKTGKNVVDTLSVLRVLDANLDFKASTPFLNDIFEDNNPSKV